MDIKVFYKEGGVSVTNRRFIANGKIYAIKDISSAQLKVIPPKRSYAMACIMMGLLFTLHEGGLFVIGGFSVVAGLLMWIFFKTNFAISLHTPAGEQLVMLGNHKPQAEKVMAALDAAMGKPEELTYESSESAHATDHNGAGISGIDPLTMSIERFKNTP